MRVSCNHVALPRGEGRDSILLVDAVDAMVLCRDGDYERVPAWQVARMFRRECQVLGRQISKFASRGNLFGRSAARLDERDRALQVGAAIEHGELVGVRARLERGANDTTREQQRLARQIAAQGRLAEGGRQYKLVAGADLDGIPDRNSYEVVSRAEALRVLKSLARQAAGTAGLPPLLTKAVSILSPDWRQPLAPSGLVLLRRIQASRVATAVPEAALTPSQMRALMEADRPLEFFARFVDEHGKELTGFSVEFDHGDDPTEEMPFRGSGFSCMGDRKGDQRAYLTVACEIQRDLVKALTQRWKEVRGAPDNQWGTQEESLRDVSLEAGKAIELVLEAGKKHTFVCRPPVVLARLHGLTFDTNKCFLLPSAVRGLKRLIDIYAQYPGWDVLIVGHADTAGTEDANLLLSAERASAMKAYLTDDVDAWLAWYGDDIPKGKRWGRVEDYDMLNTFLPKSERRSPRRVRAYQKWHNAPPSKDAPKTAPARPAGWEPLKEDGILGPKTRRQLVVDYMNIDGTSLPSDVRATTYACGEYYPLGKEAGAPDADAKDGEHVHFNRRVELFFFAKPFGILPELPGGGSADDTAKASKGDKLYPEWRVRATQRYTVGGGQREILLLDELGLPLPGVKVRVVIPDNDDLEVESNEEGKLCLDVPDDCAFDLVIDNVHEGGLRDSLKTESGQHFAADQDGPEAET
jgi:outer membrane protein OmpA-like peptidoglycan-associated protein